MSNPFDQFSSEFAAPPPAPYGGPPPMMAHQPPPMQQQAPLGNNPLYGAPPPTVAESSNPYGAAENLYGAPPAAYQQALPSDPYSGYGAPPPPQQGPPSLGGGGGGFATAAQYAPSSPPGQSVPSSVYTNQADPWGAPAAAEGPPLQPPPTLPSLGHDTMLSSQQQQQQPNPYGMPYGAPPQPNLYGGTEQQQQQQAYGAPPPDQNTYGAPPPEQNTYGAPEQQNPYGAPELNPYGAPEQNAYGAPPPPPEQNPYGAPPQPNPYGAAPEQQQPPNPYGVPSDHMQALVPSQQQSNPYAQQVAAYGQPAAVAYGGQPAAYGQPALAYGQQAAYGYGAPPPPPPVDPFSVFESKSRAPEPAAPLAIEAAAAAGVDPTASDDDFWSSFGANAPADTPVAVTEETAVEVPVRRVEEEKKGDEGLPPCGEWYDARIFTPTLGVMFFKPQELTDSLFLNTDKEIVDALGERPVVAFIVEGSSARAAGVELGHVLLKVNGVDVHSPKEASRLIKEGPRPLPLVFYVPSTEVVVAEGEHMVKYDTKETTAPNSAKDWKPKYVVIGGIIAQPWMMNMYRSKSEYDIAVIETQARRPVSVKVKQFSLQGARIQNDWQGPQMVKYKNKLHPWKYICVLPVARNPIKISSPNLSQLKPVHEGIRRVLLAQQRGGVSRRPVAQDYARENQSERQSQGDQYDSPRRSQSERQSHGDQYDSPRGGEQYGHAHPQQHGYAQPQQASGY